MGQSPKWRRGQAELYDESLLHIDCSKLLAAHEEAPTNNWAKNEQRKYGDEHESRAGDSKPLGIETYEYSKMVEDKNDLLIERSS
jgi:hypothetical protein